jgi:hypothetical protein
MYVYLFFYFYNNYFYFHFACVGIGVSTPAQLDKAKKDCIGVWSGTGIFRKYYYIILYLLPSIHHFIYILILFLPQHFLRFIPTFRSFLLLYSLQRELLSHSRRRYLISLHWCWTIIFYLGGFKDGNKVTAIVNNKVGMKGGRMNFILNGIKIPHTIINIPSDGVYLGVCIYIYVYIRNLFYLFISLLFSFFNLYLVFLRFVFLHDFFYFPS